MFKNIKYRLEGTCGSVFKIIPVAPSTTEMAEEKNIYMQPTPPKSLGMQVRYSENPAGDGCSPMLNCKVAIKRALVRITKMGGASFLRKQAILTEI